MYESYECPCPKCGVVYTVSYFASPGRLGPDGRSSGDGEPGWYMSLHKNPRNEYCGVGDEIPMPAGRMINMALCISRLEALERELEGIGGGG